MAEEKKPEIPESTPYFPEDDFYDFPEPDEFDDDIYGGDDWCDDDFNWGMDE